MGRPKRYIPGSLAQAAVIHLLALVLLIVGFHMTNTPQGIAQPDIQIIEASVIDAEELRKREEEKKRAEERERQLALQAKRRAEEKKRKAEEHKRQLALEAKRRKEEKRRAEEKKRQARLKAEQERKRKEQEKKRAEELKRKAELKKKEEERRRAEAAKREAERKEEQERKRREAEAKAEKERLAAMMAAEEAAMKAAEERRRKAAYQRKLKKLTDEYVAAIAGKIQRLWRKPANARKGDFCYVYVKQTPGGFVQDVQVQQCSGDESFRRSVEAAVWKADPFPTPQKPEVFDRELRFKFIPEG